MKARALQLDVPAVDEAIVRVLQAEQVARRAVEACAAEAQALVATARSRARAIAERGARRADRTHRIVDERIRARQAALQAGRLTLREAASDAPGEPERLAVALARLADELAGLA